jgi:hypothetical protein
MLPNLSIMIDINFAVTVGLMRLRPMAASTGWT